MPTTVVDSAPSSVSNSKAPSIASSFDGPPKKSPHLSPQDGAHRAGHHPNGATLSPPATAPEALAGGRPTVVERTSMKDKLTRMFSHKDTPKSTPSVTSNPSPRRTSFDEESNKSSAYTSAPAVSSPNNSNNGQSANSATSSANGNATGAPRKPPTPSRNNSVTTMEKAVEKAAASMKPEKKQEKRELVRFNLDPEVQGGHIHHLKSSRRQEKLSDMWRMLIGKKQQELPENDNSAAVVENGEDANRKKNGAATNGGKQEDLSLVTNWVDSIRDQKLRQGMPGEKKEGGPNVTASLTQKYGKCQEVVGRGAFGIVRISHKKAENGGAERLFAVKEFRRRPEETEKKYSKRLTAEFCISSSLRHPNIIHTLDLLKDAKGDYCEVMEFCAGGDLYTLVLSAGKLEVLEADCFFKQMMRGVEYLHEMGVAHRDLKPENLLLTTRGALKITDFGNGECFRMAWETDPHMVSGLCGSAPYIAPEEYIDKEFDARAVDVWACGVIYMAMRTGRHLWRLARKDEDEFYARYLDGRKDEEGYAPIESLHRARCRNVIYSILDPNPTRRITASQVLKSEWGREIKLCKAGEEGL